MRRDWAEQQQRIRNGLASLDETRAAARLILGSFEFDAEIQSPPDKLSKYYHEMAIALSMQAAHWVRQDPGYRIPEAELMEWRLLAGEWRFKAERHRLHGAAGRMIAAENAYLIGIEWIRNPSTGRKKLKEALDFTMPEDLKTLIGDHQKTGFVFGYMQRRAMHRLRGMELKLPAVRDYNAAQKFAVMLEDNGYESWAASFETVADFHQLQNDLLEAERLKNPWPENVVTLFDGGAERRRRNQLAAIRRKSIEARKPLRPEPQTSTDAPELPFK